MHVKYAAYGSNLHPVRLRERVASAELVDCRAVPDWRLHFHKRSRDGSAKCNIVPADDTVFFAIFTLAAVDMARLDRIEGLHDGYEEVVIDVPGHGVCRAYVAAAGHVDEGLRPYAWYKEMVLAGVEYHRLPPEYAQRIRAVEHLPDRDRDRHERNMARVKRFRRGD